MSDYYGKATLEDWLAIELFKTDTVPKYIVAMFEEWRSDIETDITNWMDSDKGDGCASWRGWGRGFAYVCDDIGFQHQLSQALNKMKANKVSVELKPCPCCDWQPDSDECPYPRTRINDWYVVVCPNPKCELEIGGENKEAAATRWNKRVVDPVFTEYTKTLNHIDDFLEYRYKQHSGTSIRDIIMENIDNLTMRLAELQNPKVVEPEPLELCDSCTFCDIDDDCTNENVDDGTTIYNKMGYVIKCTEFKPVGDMCATCANHDGHCMVDTNVESTSYDKYGNVIKCSFYKFPNDMGEL